MFATDDTIVAVATPAGHGGLGVVRVSGPRARTTAERILARTAPLRPRHATLTRVQSPSATAVDEVVATWFEAPASYTGEDVVEITAHGSPAVLEAILSALVGAGARLARPGEFTLRAFLNGRLDLVQAEAVADLVDAATPLQARVAFDQLEGSLSGRIRELDGSMLDLVASLEASLDFPDEGFHFIGPAEIAPRIEAIVARLDDLLAQASRGRVIRDGATVVIVGRPNVGKSSLFNALVGQERAIVTEWPGTTRDLVTEAVAVDGLAIRLVDTAGLRETPDVAEQEGVARAHQARAAGDLAIVVLNGEEPLTDEDRRLVGAIPAERRLLVANKSDRTPAWQWEEALPVSALTTQGLDELRRSITAALTGREPLRDSVVVSNVRHAALLRDARSALERGREAAHGGAPEEFVLADLHAARQNLAEIVGASTSADVLNRIFERFCVGK